MEVLRRQSKTLDAGRRTRYLATWDDSWGSARRRASVVYANLQALGVSSLRTRYVGPATGEPAVPTGHGSAAWAAEVDVSWRLPAGGRAPVLMTTTYTFVERHGEVVVADIAANGSARLPVWLLGPLEVRRTSRTLVAARDAADARRLARGLHQAAEDVREVLPAWRGTLVAFVPRDESELEAVLAAEPGAYDGVAAVTTTLDGSSQDAAPVAVVVNPAVFDRLGPVGARVVLAHESTHVATGAASVSMPLWVAEGFADYVGVGAVDVPLRVSARALVREVRRGGVPARLPDDSAFAGGPAAEAAYERAWLAMRMIAERYGERRMVAFYRAIVARPDALSSAVRDSLGSNLHQLTTQWRRYVSRVVDGVG